MKRIAITFSDELAELIDRESRLRGGSAAAVIRDAMEAHLYRSQRNGIQSIIGMFHSGGGSGILETWKSSSRAIEPTRSKRAAVFARGQKGPRNEAYIGHAS